MSHTASSATEIAPHVIRRRGRDSISAGWENDDAQEHYPRLDFGKRQRTRFVAWETREMHCSDAAGKRHPVTKECASERGVTNMIEETPEGRIDPEQHEEILLPNGEDCWRDVGGEG